MADCRATHLGCPTRSFIEDGASVVSTAIPIPLLQAADSKQRELSLRAFYAGPENLLANQAFETFVTDQTRLNPLVLFGPSGVGKTQFTQCIVGRWKKHNPNHSLLELNCTEFARRYNEAIRGDSLGNFQRQFEDLGLLVLEDLHLLATKPATQQQLLFLFDKLWKQQTAILTTLRAAPASVAGMQPALVSRLAMGLSVPLAKPGTAARRAMLQDAMDRFPTQFSTKAMDALAQESHLSATDMLETAATLSSAGRPVDLEQTRRELRARTQSAAIAPALIIRKTAAYFKIHLRTLKSSSRARQVVTARGVAIYLLRTLTSASLENIGKQFGNRDHTTVLHNLRKIERLAQSEPEIQEAIASIQHQLT